MTKLLYYGRNSFRIITKNEKVIYIDPYEGDYSLKADYILVTHGHGDHNQVDKVAKNKNCQIISNKEILVNGEYKTFVFDNLIIKGVQAYNKNHKKDECVGFLVFIDNLKLYFTGDTSTTEEMTSLSELNIDYAFYCCDGFYNMDYQEASTCANLVNAKYNVPIHTSPRELFCLETAKLFFGKNKLIMIPQEEIIISRKDGKDE